MSPAIDSYPPGPPAIPEGLTRPTSTYRRHAWIASAVLLMFAALYVFLAGWFAVTSCRLLMGAANGKNDDVGIAVIGGMFSAFLALFMLKGLLFVKRGGDTNEFEVTRDQQPRLFAFLDRLADEARAPRPERVFLTPGVNACVFYDLSVLNLIFPSRKNLAIGLGLVNVLTLGQLKAVCAHEFGHFAQRTMAVGRWVYIAQQIASQIIYKRDSVDRFLSGLCRVDVRIAWIGWILSLIVWSIRSLLESCFRLVVLAHRALSREMEFQADLVAVALTGSDALIEALYRLSAGDESWAQAVAFVGSEAGEKRRTKDIFAIQSRVMERVRLMTGDLTFGKEPARPGQSLQSHRIFQPELAQPPRMWLTHPPSHEREENAKRLYVPADSDQRSAWNLFLDAEALRESTTDKMIVAKDLQAVPIEESLQRLDGDFDREYLQPRYQGIYRNRSVVRNTPVAAELADASVPVTPASFDSLYPTSLAQDMARLQALNKERSLLRAVNAGTLDATGGVVRYRGKQIPRSALPETLHSIDKETQEMSSKLAAHDKMCRSVHQAAAVSLGGGWYRYLTGICNLLHYADHSLAILQDAQQSLAGAWAVASATGKVSGSDLDWVKSEANALYRVLSGIFEQADQVMPDVRVANRLKTSWTQLLGTLNFPPPTDQNLGKWLGAVDSWVGQAANALDQLRSAALDQLLVTEGEVARCFQQGTIPATSPAPSIAPGRYRTLVPGDEQRTDRKLSWWARFQTASGVLPAVARTAAALLIVGSAVAIGTLAGDCTVVAYNGLARPVRVRMGDTTALLAPDQRYSFTVRPRQNYAVEARTSDGLPIEAFNASVEQSFSHYVYNVAGASPLVEYTVIYGASSPPPPRMLGAPRWISTRADHLFEEPPKQISVSQGSEGRRVVLIGSRNASPDSLDSIQNSAQRAGAIAAHARWDPPDSANILTWMALATQLDSVSQVLAARLSANPVEVVSLRAEQDAAHDDAERRKVCERQFELARRSPASADLYYVSARCRPTTEEKDHAFLEGWKQWPQNPWLANAASYTLAERGSFNEALVGLNVVLQNSPPLAESAAIMIARLRRLTARNERAAIDDLTRVSSRLAMLQRLETGQGVEEKSELAYVKLAQGRLEDALSTAKGLPSENRIVLMVASSDGAAPDHVRRALALPLKELDSSSIFLAMALAARNGLDLAPYSQLASKLAGNEALEMTRFIDALQSSKIDSAQQMMNHMQFESRLGAYVCGTVQLGQKAPQEWRDRTKYLLFAAERPFLR